MAQCRFIGRNVPFINSVPISSEASKVWLICKYHFNSVVVMYPMYWKIRPIYGINDVVVSKLAGEFCFSTSGFIIGKIKLTKVPFAEQRIFFTSSRIIVEERSIAIQKIRHNYQFSVWSFSSFVINFQPRTRFFENSGKLPSQLKKTLATGRKFTNDGVRVERRRRKKSKEFLWPKEMHHVYVCPYDTAIAFVMYELLAKKRFV